MTDSVNPSTPTFTKAGAKPCAGLLVNDGYRRAAVGILLGGVLTYYAGWRRLSQCHVDPRNRQPFTSPVRSCSLPQKRGWAYSLTLTDHSPSTRRARPN
jgi:hypothetical protein